MPASVYGTNSVAELMAAQDMWLALLTTYPADTDSGSDLIEPTAVDYARTYLDPVNWSTANSGICSYNATVSLNPSSEWGIVTAYALCTAATAGEVYFYEYLTPIMNVKSGASVIIPYGLFTLEVA